MCGGTLQTITSILPGSKRSCLLLRIALQNALSEVVNMYVPLNLRVFVYDITALVKGKIKKWEKKDLKLSVTVHHEQKAWLKQVFEVQTWRKVRGALAHFDM